MTIEKQKDQIKPTDLDKDHVCTLELHNDDYHTFDYVIECLIEICELDLVQATQCTYLIHYKGKCDVKKGSYKNLVPLKRELSRRGLTVTIN